MPDLATLEQEFKEAVGKLPNYKRYQAFAYVSALRKIIEGKDRTITRLSEDVIKLHDQVEVNKTIIDRGSIING